MKWFNNGWLTSLEKCKEGDIYLVLQVIIHDASEYTRFTAGQFIEGRFYDEESGDLLSNVKAILPIKYPKRTGDFDGQEKTDEDQKGTT